MGPKSDVRRVPIWFPANLNMEFRTIISDRVDCFNMGRR